MRRRLLPLAGLLWVGSLPQIADCSGDPLVRQGTELMRNGEFSAALDILHQAAKRQPDPQSIDGLLGQAYIGFGFQLLEAAKYAEAEQAFAEAVDYRSDDPRPWQGQAIANLHQGRNVAAAAALQEALGLTPQDPVLYQLLGRAKYASGDMAGAVSALRQAVDLGSASARDMLAKVEAEWQLEQGMQRDFSSVFQLSYADDGQSELAGSILAVLEDAYADLGAELDFYPEIKVPVLLYTRKEFERVTASPDWAGAVYDGKIRIPIGGLKRMIPELRALLYHEYAHVVIRFLGKGRVPTWLNEGYAELAGRRQHHLDLDELDRAVAAARLLPWDRLNKGFNGLSKEQVLLAYQQSYSFCLFLVDQFGWHLFRDLIVALASGADLAAAFTSAYGDYGLTWQQLQNTWRDSL